MSSFHLPRTQSQFAWNRAIPPALEVEPGSIVTLEVANASGGQLTKLSDVADVQGLDFSRVNPEGWKVILGTLRKVS